MPRPHSIRRLLVVWLIGPLAILVVLSAIPTYFVAVNAARNAYDSALLDPALAIASHVRTIGNSVQLDLPGVALDALRVDSVDRMFFQVTGPENERIAGNAEIPFPKAGSIPQHSGQSYYNTAIGDLQVRVAALAVPYRNGRILVQVAETQIKRERLANELLLASLLPEMSVAIAAIALLWYGIGRGLAPLDKLRAEIAVRSPADLRPVPEEDKPQEIWPLVMALNQLLARLNSAIEGQKRFIANAAHQLRTPLAGLKTHAELARQEPDPVELRSLLDMIGGETERTSHLVNQLLTLARAEPGMGTDISRQPVNLHDLASRAVQAWVPRAVAKNIDLGFELEDAWTMGDALLIRELLANLLDNAMAYSPPGASVTVRTRSGNDATILEVEDSGTGIPESERERVFERFYRIAGTPGQGCGLGLAIVGEIVTRHDGRIAIGSGANGQGTCVRVAFDPLAQPQFAPAGT